MTQHHEKQHYNWPKPLTAKALQGLAGDVVKLIGPQSESDPAALLIQFLVAFGNSIGHKPHCLYEATRHTTNLFVLIAGATSGGRKGTSWNQIKRLMEKSSKGWATHCIMQGLNSAEGLIHAIAKGDNRMLVLESEFARVLKVQRREGNGLSETIRQAWESGDMQVITKKDPLKAEGAHISIVAHITQDELRQELNSTLTSNGYANRYLFVCAKRFQFLPEGGRVDTAKLEVLAKKLIARRHWAKRIGEVTRSSGARALWRKEYKTLSTKMPGKIGEVLARAEAQVTRLSLIYALLEGCTHVHTRHLEAALAVWDYCEASVRYIFDIATADPNADRILKDLQKAGKLGMSKTRIRNQTFSKNIRKIEMKKALDLLVSSRLVKRRTYKETGGAPKERYFWRS